ncbi:hypothetical protein [Dactylosporangium cerinum]
MLALVLAALRARRTQAMTLLLLSTLAAAAAAAAPWYVLASTERIATRHVESAPIQERALETVGEGAIEGGSVAAHLEANALLTQSVVELGGFTTYTQAYLVGSLLAAAPPGDGRNVGARRETDSPLTLRTGACEHATIEGRCATAANEVMLSYRTAHWLGAKPGDTVSFEATDVLGTAQFTVVGIYRPVDPADPFWSSNAQLIAADLPTGAPPEITEPVDDAILAGPAVFDQMKPEKLRFVVDMVAEPKLFVDNSPRRSARSSTRRRSRRPTTGSRCTPASTPPSSGSSGTGSCSASVSPWARSSCSCCAGSRCTWR